MRKVGTAPPQYQIVTRRQHSRNEARHLDATEILLRRRSTTSQDGAPHRSIRQQSWPQERSVRSTPCRLRSSFSQRSATPAQSTSYSHIVKGCNRWLNPSVHSETALMMSKGQVKHALALAIEAPAGDRSAFSREQRERPRGIMPGKAASAQRGCAGGILPPSVSASLHLRTAMASEATMH